MAVLVFNLANSYVRTKVCQYFVAAALLLSVPPIVICGTHFCMGGHMQHPPYSWLDHASHFAYPSLLFSVILLSKAGRLPERGALYFLVVFVAGAIFIGPGSPVPILLLLVASVVELFTAILCPIPSSKKGMNGVE